MFQEYPDIFTVENLAHALGIGRNAAYELVRSHRIASIRIGRRYCIPKIYVMDYIHNSRYRQSETDLSDKTKHTDWKEGSL